MRLTLAKHPAVRIAVFAVLFRILSAILAFGANVVFPAYQPQQFTMFGRPSAFWDPFVRYDSGWYLGIARTGYDAATAIAGGLSASISQERRYALTRDAEPLGDFLHGHSLAVQRERLCPADTGTELIEYLGCLGDQLDAEIPLRRFDYLPVGPPG